MSSVELRGDPPIPVLASYDVPVHVIVRMLGEVGESRLLRETPLERVDLDAVRAYCAAHRAEIDALLQAEATVAAAYTRLLDADDRSAERLLSASREPTVPLADWRRGLGS